jgi:hypothetical protein
VLVEVGDGDGYVFHVDHAVVIYVCVRVPVWLGGLRLVQAYQLNMLNTSSVDIIPETIFLTTFLSPICVWGEVVDNTCERMFHEQ